jgi:hypothetical protein
LLAFCFPRLLVIVCENKLLLYDLNTRKPYEVPRVVLDGKAPSCVAFLFRGGRFSPGGQPDPDNLMTSPVLAVGCSDGVVRLLHLATLRVCAPGAGVGVKGGIIILGTSRSMHSPVAFTRETDPNVQEVLAVCRELAPLYGLQVVVFPGSCSVLVPLQAARCCWCRL